MAYLIGAYQYFDDSFLQNTLDFQKPKSHSFIDNLSVFMEEHHPYWWWIMKKAKRDMFFQRDNLHAYTMFVPINRTFNTQDLMNFDINFCLTLFNRHVLRGFINKEVLESSPIQQLTTLEYGETLFFDNGMLNNEWEIIKYDVQIDNLTIHLIQHI